MMRPLTVPSTVAKAMAEIIANRNVPNASASNGADMLLSAGLMVPLDHGAKPQEERQYVEETDGRDGHDRRLTRGSLAGHRVVADEDVRQRSRAEEERDHERDEVDAVGGRTFQLEHLAGSHDRFAGHRRPRSRP